MNFTDLKTALGAENGALKNSQLTITTNKLTPNIDDLITRCYDSDPIVIQDAELVPDDSASNTLTIRGKSTFLNYPDRETEARFSVNNQGCVQLFLKYKLIGSQPEPDGWKFSKSFPDLPQVPDYNQPTLFDRTAQKVVQPMTVPLDELCLYDAYCVVVSEPQREPEFGVDLRSGINFVSHMRPVGFLGIIETLFGHTDGITVSGTIRKPLPTETPGQLALTYPASLERLQYPWTIEKERTEGLPGILLKVNLGIDYSVLQDKINFRADSLYLYTPLRNDWTLVGTNPQFVPMQAYTGRIVLAVENGQPIELDIVSPSRIGIDELILIGKFEGVSLSNLAQLSGLAGTKDSLISEFPEDLQNKLESVGKTLGALELVNARIDVDYIDITQPRLSYVSFTVGMPNLKWEIWEDKFEISSLFCSFDIDEPLSTESDPEFGRDLEVTVYGQLRIKDVPFNVYASNKDGFTVYAEMAHNERVPLEQLMETYLPGFPSTGDFSIDTLRVTVSPNHYYAMAATLADETPWEIELGNEKQLVIHDIVLWFTYPHGGSPSGYFAGSFDLASEDNGHKITVALSAKLSSTDGWQFEGSTGPGQEIPMGELLDDLAGKFSADKPELPPALANLVVTNLSVSFNTKNKDFKFTCEASSENLSSKLDINIKHQDGNYEMELGGNFDVKVNDDQSLNFALQYKREDNAKEKKKTQIFVSSYHHAGEQALRISGLVAALTQNEQGLQAIVKSLDVEIDLKSVVFVYYKECSTEQNKESEPAKFLFGVTLDIGASINLSNLPLVGNELASIGIEDLQLLIASQPFEVSHVETVNGLLPQGITKLPIKAKTSETKDSESTEAKPAEDKTLPILTKGINLSALLKSGDGETTSLVLSPSSSLEQSNGGVPTESTSADKITAIVSSPPDDQKTLEAATPSVTWIKIQKSFGPVRFERIGFQFESQNQAIWFLMDASLLAGGLTISLDELGFGSNITQFAPVFTLQGLGIEFKKDQLEIGGAFVKNIKKENEYGGKAILKTDKFSLSAVGLYADLPGQPSMFIYAFLDYPLGGPPVFYVTGLAAGFGFNRKLVMPSIDQVEEFPLVAEACGKQKPDTDDLSEELKKFGEYVPIQAGQYFLAAGVKFTSFKMIDSFAMLAVSFGQRLQIDLVGISTIKVPYSETDSDDKTKPSLSEIEIDVAFKASFIPDEGLVEVLAQLTPSSYILAKDNHPTGGLAFYTWFAGDHNGDFVLSVGGYHSKYQVPAHYPKVPRLALSWQVSNCLSIKGDAYFALTPGMLMAGGNLEANWHSGPLEAWFKAQADFLIAWQPFYYDARMSVNMGIAYTFQINTWFGSWTQRLTAELGTELHIWGPEFSGTARVRVSFISFDVAFGAGAADVRDKIGADEFMTAFLPKDLLSVSVKDGLIKSPPAHQNTELGTFDPQNLSLVIDSVVPIRKSTNPSHPIEEREFGVAPVKIPQLNTELTFTITRLHDKQNCTADFDFKPIPKNVPTALWGTSFPLDPNSDSLIKGVISGFEIRPKQPKVEPALAPSDGKATTAAMLKSRGLSEPRSTTIVGVQQVVLLKPALAESDQGQESLATAALPAITDPWQTIKDSLRTANGRRQNMLKSLGFESEAITIDDSLAETFVAAPQIEG